MEPCEPETEGVTVNCAPAKYATTAWFAVTFETTKVEPTAPPATPSSSTRSITNPVFGTSVNSALPPYSTSTRAGEIVPLLMAVAVTRKTCLEKVAATVRGPVTAESV